MLSTETLLDYPECHFLSYNILLFYAMTNSNENCLFHLLIQLKYYYLGQYEKGIKCFDSWRYFSVINSGGSQGFLLLFLVLVYECMQKYRL